MFDDFDRDEREWAPLSYAWKRDRITIFYDELGCAFGQEQHAYGLDIFSAELFKPNLEQPTSAQPSSGKAALVSLHHSLIKVAGESIRFRETLDERLVP